MIDAHTWLAFVLAVVAGPGLAAGWPAVVRAWRER